MKRNYLSFSPYHLTYAAICLALAITLPFLAGNIPEVGNMLCPMHLPVLLCGFLCGWKWGTTVGAVAPLLRSFIFARPPLYPTAVAMAFELAAYGLLAGILFQKFPRRIGYTYLSLVVAMLGGRAVGGFAQLALLSLNGKGYTAALFFTDYFVTSWPGIVIQLLLIPPIVSALRRANLVPYEKGNEYDRKIV